MAPSLKILAWSNLAAQCAEQVAVAAAPIVVVLAMGGGARETGLIQAMQTLPFLLLAIPLGLFADRYSRKRLMLCAEAIRAAAFLATVMLLQWGLLTWPLLALLGLLAACGTVAYGVAAPSMVQALIPLDGLAGANSRIELARTIAFAAGPVIGGALVGWGGAAWAFGIAAVLSICAVLLFSSLDEPDRQPLPRRKPLEDVREGARFVFRHPLLRPVFATTFMFNIAMFVLLAVFVPYGIRALGLTASGVGIVLGAYGAGMIAGALLAGPAMRALPFGVVVGIGPACGLAGSLVMVLTIAVPSPLLAGLAFLLLGSGPTVWVVSTTTLRQRVAPPDMLGRVSAINIMAQGARPIGAATGALVGSSYGMEACLVVAAICFFIQAVIIFASPVVGLRFEYRPTASSR